VTQQANKDVATPDPVGQPPSPEAAPAAEAGEPVTNEDIPAAEPTPEPAATETEETKS
jgi:hypothetical protein